LPGNLQEEAGWMCPCRTAELKRLGTVRGLAQDAVIMQVLLLGVKLEKN